MNRMPTNFGPYEREYRSRVSRPRHLLKVALRLIAMTAVVVLAGVFLFPMNARTATPAKTLQTAPRTAWQAAAGAGRVIAPRRGA